MLSVTLTFEPVTLEMSSVSHDLVMNNNHLLQELQQLCILVNDRLLKSTNVQCNLNYRPTILANEPVVLVLEASAMPVCCLYQLFLIVQWLEVNLLP